MVAGGHPAEQDAVNEHQGGEQEELVGLVDQGNQDLEWLLLMECNHPLNAH